MKHAGVEATFAHFGNDRLLSSCLILPLSTVKEPDGRPPDSAHEAYHTVGTVQATGITRTYVSRDGQSPTSPTRRTHVVNLVPLHLPPIPMLVC